MRALGGGGFLTLPLILVLDGGGWSTPHPGYFTPGIYPQSVLIGTWVGIGAGMDGWRKCHPHLAFESWDIQLPRPQSRILPCFIPLKPVVCHGVVHSDTPISAHIMYWPVPNASHSTVTLFLCTCVTDCILGVFRKQKKNNDWSGNCFHLPSHLSVCLSVTYYRGPNRVEFWCRTVWELFTKIYHARVSSVTIGSLTVVLCSCFVHFSYDLVKN